MNWKQTIGLVCVAVGLLIAAAAIDVYELWSVLSNCTVPWFCSALAIALLVMAGTCFLTNAAPAEIPKSRVEAAIVGPSVGVGLGMLVDAATYGTAGDWGGSIAEWAAFTVMLGVVFWIPRINKTNNDKPPPG